MLIEQEYALKELDYSKMTEKDRKQILAEVWVWRLIHGYEAESNRAILESLRHRNIVQLIQKIKDPKNERIYIVMEVSLTRVNICSAHPSTALPAT
jgi:NIMA (never in mitosis gene a)-related kinase 2